MKRGERTRGSGNNVRIVKSGDSNCWARSRRARYFRGFARGDTSIGVAILGRARASRFAQRSWEGNTGDARRVQAWPAALAIADGRSRTRRCGRPVGVRGLVEKKIRPARGGRAARSAGPPEGLFDVRKDAARTRATTGGGHLALQSTAAAASSNSSQWSSVHDSSGCPYESHSSSLSLHARARTGTHDHILASRRTPLAFPSAESAWEFDGPARTGASSSVRVPPLSRSALPIRGVLTWHVGILYWPSMSAQVQGTLLDVLKKKMRQTKEEMEKYKDECEEYQRRLQVEVMRREEVSESRDRHAPF